MFLSSLTHNSLGRLELLLRNALQSSSGAFSTPLTAPRGLGKYAEKAWNDIGQDLLMEGINEKHFGMFHEEIKVYMRYLVNGGTPLSEANFHPDRTGSPPREADGRIGAWLGTLSEDSLYRASKLYGSENVER